MGITCPNKKLKEFKDLVTIHGENASYSLWNEYEGNVPERFYKGVAIEYSLPSQQLPKKLQEFLDKLNFTVEFKDDLLHEYNPISLTDLLYKTILIKQDYKLEGLLKESAYVAYSFLGKKNKIRTDLVRSIENIQNYQTIFGEYKQKNPNLNDYKIKELIVIDFIADAIKNEFNTPSDSYQNRKADYWQIQGKSKLEKQIKYYLGKIKQFIENLFADTRLNREDLNALIADIANDIINQNFDKFGTLLSKEQQLTNYEKTIERDKKADEIVKNFQNLGLLLTGSLALRRQGTLYRSVNEDLHDLDFSATKELHGEYFNNLVIELAKSMEGASEQGSYFLKEAFAKRLDKEYLKHPILNKIKELYPTFKVTNTFLSTTEKNELTISGDIDGYAIDLFFVNPEKLDNNEKGFQDWQPIFEAKIKMGRAKDIRDFANYIPFNKKTNVKFGDIKGFRHFNFGNKISSNKDESIDGAVSDSSAEIQYQKQTASDEGIIASEKTIRDLAARMSDRIGIQYKVISDRSQVYKGKIEDNTAVINLAYATLDTPIHEILGHPIIRAIKNGTELSNFKYEIKELNDPNAPGKFQVETYSDENLGDIDFFDTKEEAEKYVKSLKLSKPKTQLYQNLLKELDYGRGKEVLDRIKRDYKFKENTNRVGKLNPKSDYYFVFDRNNTIISKQYDTKSDAIKELSNYDNIEYTLEEQQEEALVELLGLMTAEKLDNVKDGKLISLLKRLLKEIKSFVRSLLKQHEVEIDKLPDNMTLGDIADLLAYSNSKLILPGNEVVYTTPDNQQFKTYSEASKHISDLAKSVEDVDLSKIKINNQSNYKTFVVVNESTYEKEEFFTLEEAEEYKDAAEYEDVVGTKFTIRTIDNKPDLQNFIEKNKEYEQSKEIIEEWKKVNNIQYNPEEVYSRGQEFVSVVGAYSDFDVNLMMQNLLQHIEDNQKAGGEFTISVFTKPVDRKIGHLEGGGGKIKFKIYPQSKDIKWAANTDVFSGSVWDASEKVNKDKKSELLGVSYTKYPSLENVNTVQPNLASIIDDLAYHHNELGISLTGSNFRLEYDENIPYTTKKIIDSINSILDQKYGKLVKPEINKNKIDSEVFDEISRLELLKREDWSAPDWVDLFTKKDQERLDYLRSLTKSGIQPTQTNETLKESIDSVKVKYIGGERKIIDEFGQISYEPFDSEIQKEYTEQALINLRMVKLKEVARKYPRSLIRSEVRRINDRPQIELFESDELPFQKVPQSGTIKAGRAVIPLSERPDLYKAFKLLDSKGEIITYPTKSAGIKRLNGLNKSSELYDFDIRKTDPDEKWIIFPLRPIANLETVVEEDSPMVDDRELYDTTGDMAKYGGDMFQLPPNKRQEVIQSVDDKLKSIISDIGIKIVPYEELKEKYTGDAYGFTKLLAGNSEIGIAALRDKFTLSEESGHIYFEMLRTTPFYDRVLNELEKEDYYKTILDIDGNYQRYYDEYKGNKLALKREAAGKLLGRTIFTKTEALVNQPTGIRLLLARIKDFLKKAIAKFNYNTIKPEIDLLMGEIADNALKGTMSNLGGDVENILNTGEKLYRIKDNLEEQKKLTTKMLESVIKRQQFYKLRDDLEQFEKYQQKERELLKLIDEVKHLEGISFYLDSLKDELNDFNEKLNKSIEIYSEDKPFTPERIRKDSKSLKNMKFVVDANLTTVGAIVKELSSQYRYSKDDATKESLKAILDEARMIESNFKEADNIYSDLGTTIVSAFLTPLLGNRNSQDLLDKVNFGRPENRQLKPLNIKDALHLTEGDINMVSRWMDALADTDDGILQLIDMAVKNQKIKSDEESLNDQKDLIDAQKKLNEGGVKSTEFMAETYNGKATGYFVTEANWGEFYAERDIFFNDLNKHIKDTYDIDSYKEFKQLGDPEDVKVVKSKIAKFYSKYTLSSSPENTYFNKLNARIQRETGFETYMDLKASSPEKAASYAKDISLFFQIQGSQFAETANDVDTLLEEKRNSMSEEEFILWQYFNTREDEYTGEITILKNKNKQYQAIQNNPAQKEYYNTILKMKYDLDMLLPEKKRHPRRMIQIKKDWMERLKDATTSMDKEGLTNIMREIGESFTIAEDADDRGVKFALSTDASKVVKFLPIYYINKLKNTSELSMDITGTMAVYSTMARDFAAMNEIVDTLEIARDLIDNREILSTDSKGNPVVESLKGSNIKMIRRITKQQGKSLSADRLAGYMDMMLYGELKADEGRLGVIIDTFTKYSAITSLGLNLFAGIANLNSGFSQMRHQALSNEYFGEKSTLYADKNYWQDIGNIVSGIGRLDNRSVITGQTAKINLWRQHMNIQMDRKGDAKSLDAERKTMLGRLFDTSTLFFINNIGEHYIQTRTSLALANNYRYDKKLNKFVWREEYFAEVNKLDLKRRQEIKELGKKPTKQDIKKVNSKYKALSEKLTNDLEASWKDMTNYYEAHENVNNRLKLKEGFKSNLEDKQKFIHRTNALNKEFHGIYNDVDKNEAQRYALFRLAWQFRKWMVPYWNRRYGKGMYHAEKGDYQEGFYKVVGRFIKQMYTEVKLGEFSLRKNWNMLSQQEKANFYKVMSEVGHILGFMALAALLTAGADDDEDNWWLQMGAYQANRAVTELGSMSLPWGIQEGLKIIDQPFAGVSHIKNLSTLAAPWDWFDELERGRYEGYTKFERMLIKGTPGLSQVKDWAYPEEKMVFYTGNK